MKVTLRTLVDSFEALHQLGDDKALDVKTKYSIGRNIRIIKQEVADYEKQRIELVKQYGAKVKDTENIEVTPNNIKTFQKQIADLLDVELELDIRMLAIEAFTNQSANDMALLDWMIDETEPAQAGTERK